MTMTMTEAALAVITSIQILIKEEPWFADILPARESSVEIFVIRVVAGPTGVAVRIQARHQVNLFIKQSNDRNIEITVQKNS